MACILLSKEKRYYVSVIPFHVQATCRLLLVAPLEPYQCGGQGPLAGRRRDIADRDHTRTKHQADGFVQRCGREQNPRGRHPGDEPHQEAHTYAAGAKTGSDLCDRLPVATARRSTVSAAPRQREYTPGGAAQISGAEPGLLAVGQGRVRDWNDHPSHVP